MPPKAKAKAKAKRRVLAIDKHAQVPRDMQAAARLLDDRDLVKRTQKALGERHARDDRIDYVPAGGEQVEALAKKVEDMKTQMKAMGGTVHAESAPRLRPERWVETHSELQVWTRLQGWRRNVQRSVMPERHQPAQHCVDVGSRNKKEG